MSISFSLPGDLERRLREQVGDLDAAAREALLIRLYSTGRLSLGRLREAVGLATSDQALKWLADRGVSVNYGVQEWEQDLAAVERLRRRA